MEYLKVVHIVLGKANPNRMNGVNRVVHFLANAEVELGENVEVWGLSNDLDTDNEIARKYKLKVFLNSSKKIESTELLEALKQTKNTVFHIHGGFIPVFSKLAKLILKYGNQYVFTPHGCFTTSAMAKNSFKKKLFLFLFERNMMKKAKVVQCLGYQEQKDMQALVPKAKYVLIPNGQETITLEEPKAKTNSSGLIFGFCGRLDRHHKGLDFLIDGFVKFKQGKTDKIKLWIIGGGPYKTTMEEDIAKANLSSSCVFFGPKFGDEKFNLIAQMDAFFHPSRHEGLPTAVLEACYLGIPCAVTPETSFDQYILDYNAGWQIGGLSGDAVAQSMESIYKDFTSGLIGQKAQNAAQMTKNDFSWIEIAKRIVKIY